MTTYRIFRAPQPGPLIALFQLIDAPAGPDRAAPVAGLHAGQGHESEGLVGGVRAGVGVVTGPPVAFTHVVFAGVPGNGF